MHNLCNQVDGWQWPTAADSANDNVHEGICVGQDEDMDSPGTIITLVSEQVVATMWSD